MNNNKGQSILESVLILPCLGLVFVCLGCMVYAGFARAWIGYQTDLALFCMAEGGSEFQCKKSVERSMNRFLPFGQFHRFQLSSSENTWKSDVDWRWNQVKLQKQKTLKWDSSIWR